MKIIINPKPITKENFSKFGDMITTNDIKPLEINNGYAKRFDGIANVDTSQDNGKTIISIFSALKRSFPMKINMMEKHPLGSQAFIPNKSSSSSIVKSSNKWKFLMNKVNLSANKTHKFKNKLMKDNKINFIKINIFPDGGISRFKIFGKSI